MMIGILPTVTAGRLGGEALTANPRYRLLNEQVFAARGEDIALAIDSVERLRATADTIAPEAVTMCRHIQVQEIVRAELGEPFGLLERAAEHPCSERATCSVMDSVRY